MTGFARRAAAGLLAAVFGISMLAGCTPNNAAVGDTQSAGDAVAHSMKDRNSLDVALIGSQDEQTDRLALDAMEAGGLRPVYLPVAGTVVGISSLRLWTDRTMAARTPADLAMIAKGCGIADVGTVREASDVAELVTAALRTEDVQVERVPVNRQIDEAPAIRTEGDVTIVPIVEDQSYRVVPHRFDLRDADIVFAYLQRLLPRTVTPHLCGRRIHTQVFEGQLEGSSI